VRARISRLPRTPGWSWTGDRCWCRPERITAAWSRSSATAGSRVVPTVNQSARAPSRVIYRMFGLTVSSSIRFAGLVPVEGSFDDKQGVSVDLVTLSEAERRFSGAQLRRTLNFGGG